MNSRNPLSPANEGYSFAGQLFQSPIGRGAFYRWPAAPACIYIPGAEGTMNLPFVLPRFAGGRIGGHPEGRVNSRRHIQLCGSGDRERHIDLGSGYHAFSSVIYLAPQGAGTVATDRLGAVGVDSSCRTTYPHYT